MSAEVTDINAARSALSFALAYIRLGWWVLPLDPGTKKPLGRFVHNGFHDATNDTQRVTRWWSECPDAGIGIALRKSGLVAIDIDPRNGGIETIDQLEAQHGPIASDVLAFTGGGGEHRVFSAGLVDGLPGKLGPGVDLKADGYIAVEPTLHPSGRRYQWEASSDPIDGVVPTTLPTWIRDLGRARAALAPVSLPDPHPVDPARLQSVLEALRYIPSDDRETWFRVGMAIHNEMPGQAGFDLWEQWSRGSSKFDAQDQLRVWRSFKRKGLAGLGLNTVFAMAQEAGWRNTGVKVETIDSHPRTPLHLLSLAELREAAQRVSWLVKHVVPSASLGVMFGASGTFKSFVALDMALHVAHGMPWLGKKTKTAPVLFIAAEGGAGVWRRVDAWHRARGLQWGDIPFYVLPVAIRLGKCAADVVEAAKALGLTFGLVVVDTMSQTYDGEENSANEVAKYFTELGTRFRDTWQCATLVIHHSGHAATERPRGSSAILANVDFMFGVFRDEKDMLCTVECHKQKDGDLFAPATFELSSHVLGHDEDGDEIRSLAAKHMNHAEALLEALAENKRRGKPPGGLMTLLQIVQSGAKYSAVKLEFYKELGEKNDEAKKRAWNRAVGQAKDMGFVEVVNGEFLVLKGANDGQD